MANQTKSDTIHMQALLRALGHDIDVDGISGKQTRAALKEALGDDADGDILAKLQEKLQETVAADPSHFDKLVEKVDLDGNNTPAADAFAMQAALNAMGAKDPEDGSTVRLDGHIFQDVDDASKTIHGETLRAMRHYQDGLNIKPKAYDSTIGGDHHPDAPTEKPKAYDSTTGGDHHPSHTQNFNESGRPLPIVNEAPSIETPDAPKSTEERKMETRSASGTSADFKEAHDNTTKPEASPEPELDVGKMENTSGFDSFKPR